MERFHEITYTANDFCRYFLCRNGMSLLHLIPYETVLQEKRHSYNLLMEQHLKVQNRQIIVIILKTKVIRKEKEKKRIMEKCYKYFTFYLFVYAPVQIFLP